MTERRVIFKSTVVVVQEYFFFMIFTPTANVFYSLIDMVPSNKKEIILCPHKKKI